MHLIHKQLKTTTFLPTDSQPNIRFTKEEMDLLNMGLQYNLHKPSATNWTKLAIETEQAIRLPDDSLQDTFRIMAA